MDHGKERTERKEEKHQTATKGDEWGEIESEGLREQRNQGNDLDDDSAVNQRVNLTERARELTREGEVVRGRDSERERDGSHESTRERERGVGGYTQPDPFTVFSSSSPVLLTEWMIPRRAAPFCWCLWGCFFSAGCPALETEARCVCAPLPPPFGPPSLLPAVLLSPLRLSLLLSHRFPSASLFCCFIGIRIHGIMQADMNTFGLKM